MTNAVDLSVRLGPLGFKNPIMTAAGTAGYSVELANAIELSGLGAHVVKSLAVFANTGNPAPRLAPLPGGMLNSVGLPGPGIRAWIEHDYPDLCESGARFAVSVWGRSVEDYVNAVDLLGAHAPEIAFIELNVSCPNTDAHNQLFAHDPEAVHAIVHQCASVSPHRLFVKLSPNTDRNLEVATTALHGGAQGFVAINTVFGQWFRDGKPVLGTARGGGLSGPQVHAIALRQVAELREEFPDTPIIGVGGIGTVDGVLRMLEAGANAIQVGTASFVDPRRPYLLVESLRRRMSAVGEETLVGFLTRYGRGLNPDPPTARA